MALLPQLAAPRIAAFALVILALGSTGLARAQDATPAPAPVAEAAAPAAAPVQGEILDRVVAVVNDSILLQSDLDQAMTDAKVQLQQRSVTLPADDVLRPQVLERAIITRIQTQRAAQAGIRVDDRDLNDVLTNIARANRMTLAEFAQKIAAQGMDFLNAREQIRDQVLVARLRQKEVESRVMVTDQDIDLYLANQGPNVNFEYHLLHILVSVPDSAGPEEREKRRARVQGLLKRIQDGEDFSQVAITSSDGQQALKGGDLDWRKAGDLPSAFATAAAELKDGGVSGVLETGAGFHLIKLLGSRGGVEHQTVEETHAQHILLRPNQLRTEEQTKVQAQDLYDRLQKGGDFEKLAREFSDDPGSRNSGGDLGWQPPGLFTPDFEQQLNSLKPGEMSAPFHTQFGWHIARVVDRRTRDVTVEARRAAARKAIEERKVDEEYDTWLRRLRAEAYIEYRAADGTPIDADGKPLTYEKLTDEEAERRAKKDNHSNKLDESQRGGVLKGM